MAPSIKHLKKTVVYFVAFPGVVFNHQVSLCPLNLQMHHFIVD